MYRLWGFPRGEDAGAIHLCDAVSHKHFVPLEAGGAACAPTLDVREDRHHVPCLHVYQKTQITGLNSFESAQSLNLWLAVGYPTLWTGDDPWGEDMSASQNSTATLSADNNLWAELHHTSDNKREKSVLPH